MSAGMEPAEPPVTVRDGDFLSPDAPRGTGGHQSKYVYIDLLFETFHHLLLDSALGPRLDGFGAAFPPDLDSLQLHPVGSHLWNSQKKVKVWFYIA